MKEIKFRAWDKKEHRMFKVDCLEWNNDHEISGDVGNLEHDDLVGFARIELMQYTGLKDKNGVEIYEGDIVQLGAYNNVQKKWLPSFKCEVKFTLEHGGYAVSTPYTDNHFNDFEAKYCEVIGNIYGNPELVKED